MSTPTTPEQWAELFPNVLWWGIDPRTGFPAHFSFGERHPNKTNVLINVLLPSDPIQEWHYTEDGGETWRKLDSLTDELLSKTQVLIR